MSAAPCLRLILGDQLSLAISSLRDADPARDLILMCELSSEASYVRHHRQKLVLVLSAMRHFAKRLRSLGFRVHYRRLDDAEPPTGFTDEIERILARSGCRRCVLTEPGEYRLRQLFEHWQQQHPQYTLELREDDRFLCSHAAFRRWASGRRQLRMEHFYRWMRRQHQVLMTPHGPVGERWNLDADNRKPLPDDLVAPSPCRFEPDAITRDVMQLVATRFADHFGSLDNFALAVTEAQAQQALERFITERLPRFGDYQDAMRQQDPWLFHAHLSGYLNLGLLDPRQVIRRVEQAYRDGQAPLNAVEGFIRQILGWREYVRGVYWLQMPGYAQLNHLQARRPLPGFYWDADTELNCLHQCVEDTRRHAYAHHIQRLMVLGNFALLAGLDPAEVNRWYLLVYADAYEWVELPNVHGMALFADGGLLASKPYAAGGAYINRMSDYCRQCRFDVRQKSGPKACPFNYLYWDFMIRNADRLRHNPRLALPYRQLERMSPAQRQAIEASAGDFLARLDRDSAQQHAQ